MLHKFLRRNQKKILQLTEKKFIESAEFRASSKLLRQGLPNFYQLLLVFLEHKHLKHLHPTKNTTIDSQNISFENEVMKSAGFHGKELLRLDYTLSHVVHAYGYMCQAITETAAIKDFAIGPDEFHNLNRFLDVAIAGAVTKYQLIKEKRETKREMEHLGSLAHELRNGLTSVNLALHFIKNGMVGFAGSTGQVLTESLKQMDDLIERSMTEVRLHIDPTTHVESINLLHIVDLIMVTAAFEAELKNQVFEVQIDSNLTVKADKQFFHSALFNLIQNALKYAPNNSTIQIRGNLIKKQIIIEVENECRRGSSCKVKNLLTPFTQGNKDNEGIGLGLSIAQRAIKLNHGTLEASTLNQDRCVFRIKLPA